DFSSHRAGESRFGVRELAPAFAMPSVSPKPFAGQRCANRKSGGEPPHSKMSPRCSRPGLVCGTVRSSPNYPLFDPLSSRPERPDFFFRADLWRVGPRSGGISLPPPPGHGFIHAAKRPQNNKSLQTLYTTLWYLDTEVEHGEENQGAYL